jgi:hypothetical protein
VSKDQPTEGDAEINGGSAEVPSPIEVTGPSHVDKLRAKVTVGIVAFFCLFVFGHYSCVVVLDWNGKKTDSIKEAFNVALPIVSGLVSSVIT